MIALQVICLAIVILYVSAHLLRSTDAASRRAFLLRFSFLACAAAIGEDSVIRAYGTYAYARGWSVFIDRVPLVVVLVWPVVIDSAAAVARCLVVRSPYRDEPRLRDSLKVAAIAAAIVLADASLIEPIAVHAKLWAWTDPGPFDVPLIGIAGWSMFAFAATAVLGFTTGGYEHEHERSRALARARSAIVVVIAPLATHTLILMSWWILFRFIQGPIARHTTILAAWLVFAPASIALFVSRVGARIPRSLILLRAPGALFFFGLLATAPRDLVTQSLFLYALAFAPPYLVILMHRTNPTHGVFAHATPRK